MYINLVVSESEPLVRFLDNYDISFLLIEPHSTVCLWRSSRTQTRPYSTIAPHQSSSYPEYLSPTWDEETQRAVVWTRLQEHCKLASHSLSKINEQYKALRQEQQTQVESHRESSSHDTLIQHLLHFVLFFFSHEVRWRPGVIRAVELRLPIRS